MICLIVRLLVKVLGIGHDRNDDRFKFYASQSYVKHSFLAFVARFAASKYLEGWLLETRVRHCWILLGGNDFLSKKESEAAKASGLRVTQNRTKVTGC